MRAAAAGELRELTKPIRAMMLGYAFLMRILVLSNVVPYPPHSGLQLRILRIFERVARRHEVTLACHVRSAAEEAQARELDKVGIRTLTGRLKPGIDWTKIAWAVRFGITARPPELALYRSSELAAGLRELLRKEVFDILQVEEPLLAPYTDFLPNGSATRRILSFADLHWIQDARAARLESSPGMRAYRRFNGLCMRLYEPKLAREFERSIVVSNHDRGLLLEAAPGLHVDVVPNGVDTAALRPLEEHDGPPADSIHRRDVLQAVRGRGSVAGPRNSSSSSATDSRCRNLDCGQEPRA